MNYILAPYVSVGYSKDKVLKLGFGSIQSSIKDKKFQEIFVSVCDFLTSPRTLEDMSYYMSEVLLLSPKEGEEVISLLKTKNLLIEERHWNKSDRYSRHSLFYNMSGGDPSAVQKKLSNSHVVIQGCGGIGNVVSVTLATAGIGKMTLIDDDQIELSNLSRQILFREKEVGLSKTEVLKKSLVQRSSNLEVEIINKKIDKDSLFNLIPKNCDLLVISGDSPRICHQANNYCFEKKIPFINICYILDVAVFGPFFIPGKTPCFECFARKNISNNFPDNKNLLSKIKHINSFLQAPSIGPVNMISSSFACLDIIKYLGGFGTVQSINKRIGIWTDSLRMEWQEYTRNPECEICG